jgi:hypothetical protein
MTVWLAARIGGCVGFNQPPAVSAFGRMCLVTISDPNGCRGDEGIDTTGYSRRGQNFARSLR